VIDRSGEEEAQLRAEHGVSFAAVEAEILAGRFIGPEDNPARPGQRRIIVRLRDYPHVVPLVIDENGDWFLKTIIPSRKARKEGRI
jgi:hypothetical protein